LNIYQYKKVSEKKVLKSRIFEYSHDEKMLKLVEIVEGAKGLELRTSNLILTETLMIFEE